MADSRSHRTPQFSTKESRLNHSKSNFSAQVSQFLCKSIVVLVFVIAIPLFPSQTPEIFNNTLLNKFWELFHLLFIGLAVCYGLFSRRSSDLELETTHLIDDSQSSFVSRIFHVSPIFEDGSEIQCGSDEKNGYMNWDSQIYKDESRSRCTVNVGNDEQIKIGGFPNSECVSEVLEEDENHVVQAWSSQYFHGEPESVVIVSEPNYGSENWGKPRNVGDFQPLGLPVRSLSSRVRNSDSSYQFSNRSLSDSSLMGSSNCPPMEVEEVKFGDDQGPVFSGEKLIENVFLPSQNPWGFRSVRESVVPVSNRNSDTSHQGFRSVRESVVPVSNRNSDTSHQFSNGDLSGSSLIGSSNCSPKSMEEDEENFGEQGRVNSDEKLNENVFLPSHNPWVSRPGRPELRARVVPKSTRSHSRNSDNSHQFSNGNLSGSSLSGSSNCSPKNMEEVEEKFGDFDPVNPGEKLNENGFLPSQNPWVSRPGRPELRERVVPKSTRSHSRNSDNSHQFSNGNLSGSSLTGSSNCSPKNMEEVEEKFGDFVPVNPGEKLNENRFLPSRDPRVSRPGRSELRESSHFRPRSVDETQFESFKSQSLRSNASLSSQTSSVSTSPDLLSPSHSSSSDSPKSGTEKPVKIEEKEATLSPLATESPKREAPLNAFHLRRYSSSGSLFQKNPQKRAKEDPKNPGHKRREEDPKNPGHKRKEDEQEPGSSKPDKKSTNSRSSSRGKSVRTIRSSGGYTPEAKKYGEDLSKLHVDDPDSTKKKNLDAKMREKKEALEKVTVESEPEIDEVLVRLAKKSPAPYPSDSGHDPNEVDKKASEFIAKFREQIRLQKVASMERSKVVRMSGKYLR